MKRLIPLIALLHFLLITFAQPTTTINGNYKNDYNKRTSLKISWFDTETLTLKEDILKGQAQDNGDFIFLTDKIGRDYTQCWLQLGNSWSHPSTLATHFSTFLITKLSPTGFAISETD